MAQSVDDRGRGARLARRDEGASGFPVQSGGTAGQQPLRDTRGDLHAAAAAGREEHRMDAFCQLPPSNHRVYGRFLPAATVHTGFVWTGAPGRGVQPWCGGTRSFEPGLALPENERNSCPGRPTQCGWSASEVPTHASFGATECRLVSPRNVGADEHLMGVGTNGSISTK